MAGLSNIGSVFFPPNIVSPNEKTRVGDLSANAKTRGLGGLLEDDLSAQEKRVVQELRQRDLEVRQHEQAHMAAAGGYARGGANYSYTVGPDGKRYATGGEVSIDVSAEANPEATIRKMEVVKRAAMAPPDPSAADRAVYAAAQKTEMAAQQQLAEERREEGGQGWGIRGIEANESGRPARNAEPLSPVAVVSDIYQSFSRLRPYQGEAISAVGPSGIAVSGGDLLDLVV